MPHGIEEKHLTHSTFPETCRTIINAEITATLTARNGLLPIGQEMRYQQLFNFYYKDGAPMLTIGGIFVTVQVQDSALGKDVRRREMGKTGEIGPISPRIAARAVIAQDAWTPS